MPKRLSRIKYMEMKQKFWAIDKSGDNKLSFAEMKTLLVAGNADLSDAELKVLYNRVDANGDGCVDFDEFVEFVYEVPRTYVVAPEAAQEKFTEFCGKAMDVNEFGKLCADCGLLNRHFRKEDVAATFSRVVPRGKRTITLKPGRDGYSQYDKLLCLIADKRNLIVEEIHELVASGEVSSNATVADAVRFHDDKSLYTGASGFHVRGRDKGGGVSPRPPRESDYDVGPPGNWDPVLVTFASFDKDNNGLNNREFVKLCEDSGLIEGKLNKGDVDIIFMKMKERRLGPEKFKEALAEVAEKKKQQLSDIQEMVGDCLGPVVRATVPDDVRFHDDKSTYTGIHAGK